MSEMDEVIAGLMRCQGCGEVVNPKQKHDIDDCAKYRASQSVQEASK